MGPHWFAQPWAILTFGLANPEAGRAVSAGEAVSRQSRKGRKPPCLVLSARGQSYRQAQLSSRRLLSKIEKLLPADRVGATPDPTRRSGEAVAGQIDFSAEPFRTSSRRFIWLGGKLLKQLVSVHVLRCTSMNRGVNERWYITGGHMMRGHLRRGHMRGKSSLAN